MKFRRLISAVLILVLLAAALPGAAFAALTPTEWAVTYVNNANTSGVLTPNAARDYHRALTREEFCELIVIMAERILGKELPMPAKNPFTDSDSAYVLKANAYGVVNGMTDTTFEPNLGVERQHIVTMMIRAIRKLESDTGKSFLSPGVATLPFKDNAKVGDYAVEYLKIAYANGIVQGDDVGNFNPKDNVSSQECVAIIIRSFDSMHKTLAIGKTNQQIVDLIYDTLELGLAYGDTMSGVTQNITLATSGLGDASIKWQTSNANVISSAGAVSPPSSATNVTLTATITLGAATKTKTFAVRTSQYKGDKLLVENAYNELDIFYLNGDSADCVTGRICLPTTVLGLPIKWTSSNTAVVTAKGAVTVPTNDEVRTVTLTAAITQGTESRTKTFTLKVMNALYKTKGATLHGVEFGMTPSQVTAKLGTVRRSITTSGTETWQLYHTNYNNFIAVAFINNKAVAVYSMSSGAQNALINASTNTAITVAQANTISGVKAEASIDLAGTQYAIALYDTTSAIVSSRTLQSEGQEQLLLELINAYRYKNGLSTLTINTKLASSARAHSSDMSAKKYLSNKTYGTNNTHVERAAAKGYDSALVSDGFILGGLSSAGDVNDVLDLFKSMVSHSTLRPHVVKTTNTVAGFGFIYSTTGEYKMYLTYVFGTLIPISGVTASPTSVQVGVGESKSVALTLSPTSRNETYSITSSNTGIMNVTSSASGNTNTATVTVKGVSAGTTDLTITGNSSGAVYRITVTVGANYVTSMGLSYNNTPLAFPANPGATATSTNQLIMGTLTSDKLTITATPDKTATVTWSVVSVNGNNLVSLNTTTGNSVTLAGKGTAGTVTIRASVPSGTSTVITRDIKVNLLEASITTTGNKTTVEKGSSLQMTMALTPPSGSSPGYGWSTTQPTAVTIGPVNSNPTTLTPSSNLTSSASPTVTALAAFTTGIYRGQISRSITITVTVPQTLTGIVITSPKTQFVLGEEYQFTATDNNGSTSGYTFAWSVPVGDTVAAITSNGKLTATSTGNAKVKVTLTVGGVTYDATVDIEVVAPSFGIYGQSTADKSNISSISLQCDLAGLPDALNYSVSWSVASGSESYISILGNEDTCSVTLLATGTATVTATLLYKGVPVKTANHQITINDSSESESGGSESGGSESGGSE